MIVVTAQLLVGLVVAPLASALSGTAGLLAVLASMAVCLVTAIVTDLTDWILCSRGPERAFEGVMVTMSLRMAMPLGALLVVYVRGGILAEAGMAFYLTAFYLVTLAVQTSLTVVRVARTDQSPQVS